jgi:hypothetical protein
MYKINFEKLQKQKNKFCFCELEKIDNNICPCDEFCETRICKCGIFESYENIFKKDKK